MNKIESIFRHRKVTAVLFPAQMRDIFMHLALKGVFRPRWSDEIHNEWIRAVLQNRPDLTNEQLQRTRFLMDSNVIGCLIKNYENYIPNINLPDENDRHVVTVAIKSKADVIVTFNLKDFPEQELNNFNIIALHPDIFLEQLLIHNTAKFIDAMEEQIKMLKNPPISKKEFVKILQNSKLPQTATRLNQKKF
ncbi:PIN domain-containing protein [Cyanobacterium aponinum UTEX 3221]|uniref:PIN domain-containing protein n=1 Tax=Cyanobacterium aponinum TaxID=379064 RepID=UPI002B4BAB83|nr:PIN domain-containing protein [Cyanobacterium aponinum]WRL36983.1 PIN domain-containing protein [Cyanobacterium aponinum UTEX 3221]